jgi:hypothetical protein
MEEHHVVCLVSNIALGIIPTWSAIVIVRFITAWSITVIAVRPAIVGPATMMPTRVATIKIIIVLFHYVFVLVLIIVVVVVVVVVVVFIFVVVDVLIIICWLVVGDLSHLIAACRP